MKKCLSCSIIVQAKHDLKGKAELLVLIRKVPEGLPMSDLKDSYTGVTTDIQVEYMFITCHMANSWWVLMIFNFTFTQFTIVAIWLELLLLMLISRSNIIHS